MTAPDPNQPPQPQQPTYQPPADNSSRFLKLSGAALIWTVIGIAALCIGAPVACCMGGVITGAGRNHTRTTTSP